MAVLEWIIKIGAGLTAVYGIFKFLQKLFRIPSYFRDMHRHTFENYMSILRITIMDPHMPLGERILAAEKYIKYGGNGEVKKYAVEELHVKEMER